mmetsp:Transcript_29412/g.61508  ORF Transcript_29412/g.61508 Transcript_29412/m.61508 type:complete len:214 (-) Transcript_29412:316-957(-)
MIHTFSHDQTPHGLHAPGRVVISENDVDIQPKFGGTHGQVAHQINQGSNLRSPSTTQNIVFQLGLGNIPHIQTRHHHQGELQTQKARRVTARIFVNQNHKNHAKPGTKDQHDGEQGSGHAIITRRYPSFLVGNGHIDKIRHQIENQGIFKEGIDHGHNFTSGRIIPVGANIVKSIYSNQMGMGVEIKSSLTHFKGGTRWISRWGTGGQTILHH